MDPICQELLVDQNAGSKHELQGALYCLVNQHPFPIGNTSTFMVEFPLDSCMVFDICLFKNLRFACRLFQAGELHLQEVHLRGRGTGQQASQRSIVSIRIHGLVHCKILKPSEWPENVTISRLDSSEMLADLVAQWHFSILFEMSSWEFEDMWFHMAICEFMDVLPSGPSTSKDVLPRGPWRVVGLASGVGIYRQRPWWADGGWWLRRGKPSPQAE